MQYQQTPQSLDQLYNLPVAMAPQGMNLMDQMQNADQMTQQDQARQLSFDTANDPLKLQGKDLENQTLAAQLPGHAASSSIRQRQNTIEGATTDAHIQDILGKYSTEAMGRHVQDASQAGERLSQMGAEAFSNPMGAAQRVKAELSKMGLDKMWNPAWETSDPGLLARQLTDYGDDMQKTSSKFKQAMEIQQAKNAAVAGTNETRENVARINAEQRANTAASLMATKKAIANIPKSLNDYASKMAQLADEETDPSLKTRYKAEAESAANRANALASAGAATTTAQKLDLNKILGPGSTWGDPPNNMPSMTGAQVPTDLPQGTQANGDGTFTLPDGRKVRPKAK